MTSFEVCILQDSGSHGNSINHTSVFHCKLIEKNNSRTVDTLWLSRCQNKEIFSYHFSSFPISIMKIFAWDVWCKSKWFIESNVRCCYQKVFWKCSFVDRESVSNTIAIWVLQQRNLSMLIPCLRSWRSTNCSKMSKAQTTIGKYLLGKMSITELARNHSSQINWMTHPIAALALAADRMIGWITLLLPTVNPRDSECRTKTCNKNCTTRQA
jgi:hypothetical protein